MRALFVLMILSGVLTGPALAADMSAGAMPTRQATLSLPAKALPFARSERAQSVWASGTCWNQCGAYCAAGLVGCLKRDAQGQCLQATDRCDRICQTQCRTEGGPLVPDLLDF